VKRSLPVLALALTVAVSASAAPRRPRKRTPASAPAASFRSIGPEPARFTGEPISLDLKDAELKDVLRTFARIGRFNLVVDPEVKGSVTVRLEDVPWDQALDVILRSNGLGYVVEGNVLRAGTPAKLAASP
jgi:type IV pilus assembly protein PilQ